MNWTDLWNRMRGRPHALDNDLDDELAFHAEMKRREFESRGLAPADAQIAAR